MAFMPVRFDTDDYDTLEGGFDSDPAGRKDTTKISRFEDGRIAEDWGYSDTIEIRRTLIVVAKEWRVLLGRD
jgi:hypothetical protein